MNKYEIAKEKGITYDPITGIIYGVKGNPINRKTKDGYINISIRKDGEVYQLYGHQYAFYIMYNYIPKCIDHIDMNPSNNKISNLRDIPKKQNHYNTKAKGCSYDKNMNKWHSYINKDGIRTNLGYYNTKEEAHKIYLEHKNKIHIYE